MSYKARDIIEILKLHPYIKNLSDDELLSIVNLAYNDYIQLSENNTVILNPSEINEANPTSLSPLSQSYYSVLDVSIDELAILPVELKKIIYSIAIERVRKLKKNSYNFQTVSGVAIVNISIVSTAEISHFNELVITVINADKANVKSNIKFFDEINSLLEHGYSNYKKGVITSASTTASSYSFPLEQYSLSLSPTIGFSYVPYSASNANRTATGIVSSGVLEIIEVAV